MGKLKNIKKESSDIFVNSFPKAGNYWLRFLLGTYLHEKIDWNNVSKIAPMTYNTTKKRLKSLPRPRIMGNHEKYSNSFPKINTIYLYRDPRDVVISKYFYDLKMGNTEKEFDEYFDYFLREGSDWIGSWKEHVKNGLFRADIQVSYEDLLEDTSKKLKEILTLLNLDIDQEKIKEAVEWCSFENMKKLEEKQGWIDEKEAKRKNIKFMRKGTSRQWEDFLTKRQQEKMEDSFEEIMRKLDYI